MRRLCKPHALSITRAELSALVRRKTSLTIRHRLTPALTFSTTTRALEKLRLRTCSPPLNSWPFGFFGAARSGRRQAQRLESRGPWRAWRWPERRSALQRRPSGRAVCRRGAAPASPLYRWCRGPAGGSCPSALTSCRGKALFAGGRRSGVGGGAQCHPGPNWAPPPASGGWGQRGSRRAPAPGLPRLRRAARLALRDESSSGPEGGSAQIVRRACLVCRGVVF